MPTAPKVVKRKDHATTYGRMIFLFALSFLYDSTGMVLSMKTAKNAVVLAAWVRNCERIDRKRILVKTPVEFPWKLAWFPARICGYTDFLTVSQSRGGGPRRNGFNVVRELTMEVGEVFPGIEVLEEVCGGEACLVRTRIPVWFLVQARRCGTSEAEWRGT